MTPSEIKQKQTLEQIIQKIWAGAAMRVESASGGFLVEIVDGKLLAANRGEDQRKLMIELQQHNLKTKLPVEIIVIHRLFMYEANGDQFKTHGTLHNRQADYEDGIHTTYLDSGDAYVWIPEVDAQALLYGVERPFKCRVISETTKSGDWMFDLTQDYKEIEFEGTHMPVRNKGRYSADVSWVEVI